MNGAEPGKASAQADPVPPEPVAQAVAVGGGAAMPQPVEAYAVSPFSAPAQRVTPESAFAPPAYGGPASRSTAPRPQVRMPQPVAVGAGAGELEPPGFEMQQPSGFSALDAPIPGANSQGVPPTRPPRTRFPLNP